jgi:hypothetical protein
MQEGQDVWAKTQRPRSLGDCTIGTLDYSESKVSVRTKGEFGDALSRPTSEQGPGDISTWLLLGDCPPLRIRIPNSLLKTSFTGSSLAVLQKIKNKSTPCFRNTENPRVRFQDLGGGMNSDLLSRHQGKRLSPHSQKECGICTAWHSCPLCHPQLLAPRSGTGAALCVWPGPGAAGIRQFILSLPGLTRASSWLALSREGYCAGTVKVSRCPHPHNQVMLRKATSQLHCVCVCVCVCVHRPRFQLVQKVAWWGQQELFNGSSLWVSKEKRERQMQSAWDSHADQADQATP